MSQISNAIFAALAVSAACGAVQFAFGHDLTGSPPVATNEAETGVNRAAKTDRAAVPASPVSTRTIALRFDGLADTSVLIRMPVAREEARSRPTPPSLTRSGNRKATVACEPVVSVLTEVAKLLQPGRCVT